MKRNKCLFVFFLSLTNLLSGQTYFSKLIETPYPYVGGILGAIETMDSGFILMNTSFDIFQDTNKLNIIKVNRFGNIIWQKSYGAEGTAHEQYEVIKTRDSCYLFCGLEWKNDTASAFMFKINAQGDSLWMKIYDSDSYLCFFGNIIETSDKGFIAIGGCDKDKPGGPDPYRQNYTVKTDSIGNVEWQLIRGSTSLNENSFGIVETPNHEYLQSGNARNPYLTDFYVYSQLVKIKNNGQIEWVKNYSDQEYYQGFFDINRTLDGNYLIAGGYANDEDIFPSDPYGGGGTLTKIDENGTIIWFKRYGDEIYDAECYDFVELSDSNIVTIGYRHQPWERSTLVKFNNKGEIIWVQPYLYNSVFESNEALFKVIHTKDDGFLMTGYAHNPNLDTIGFSIGKGWILKVDSIGCATPMCIVSTEESNVDNKNDVTIFPNPFTNNFDIRLPENYKFEIINIYDLAGKKLISEIVQNKIDITIDGSQFNSGVYIVEIRSNTARIIKKIVKIE